MDLDLKRFKAQSGYKSRCCQYQFDSWQLVKVIGNTYVCVLSCFGRQISDIGPEVSHKSVQNDYAGTAFRAKSLTEGISLVRVAQPRVSLFAVAWLFSFRHSTLAQMWWRRSAAAALTILSSPCVTTPCVTTPRVTTPRVTKPIDLDNLDSA